MADTSVAITAGSGIAIDTRTESTNSNHRQVIVVGDPLDNNGTSAVLNTTPSTSDYGQVVRPVTSVTGPLHIVGTIASASADSGNPLKVGSKYNASAPTFTDGNRADLQSDVNGNLKATLATLIAGEDLTNNLLKVGGNVASGATDVGNPVKAGGRYNSSAPTLTNGQRGDLQLDSSGNLKVNVTAGGGAGTSTVTYNSTPPVVTNGNSVTLQGDSSGNLLVSLATKIAGEDITNDRLKVEHQYSYNHISSGTTTTVKASAGFLHSITVNTTAAGTITIYDNTTNSGTVIGILKASVVERTFVYDISMTTGITIVTAAASDLTVSYR